MITMQYYLKQGVAMFALAGVLVAAQALGDTTATPPNDNAPAPLNVSNVGQVKAGGLSVNWGDGTTGAAFGLIVPFGKSGFGTKTPEATLDIDGSIYTKGGTGDVDGNGTVTTADSSLIWRYTGRGSTGVTLTRAQQAEADIDGNGVVTEEDAKMALYLAAHPGQRESAEYYAYNDRLPSGVSCAASGGAYDVNGSGSVSSTDSLAALTIVSKSSNAYASPLCNHVRTDVNGDGLKTTFDAIEVLRAAVGLAPFNEICSAAQVGQIISHSYNEHSAILTCMQTHKAVSTGTDTYKWRVLLTTLDFANLAGGLR